MARLFDSFRALFTFGLELDASIADARESRSPQAIQDEVLSLLDEARSAARVAGAKAAQIESASFAIVAWLDEILGRLAGAPEGVPPLQVKLFNSNNAQSEFFHHLSALGPDDSEVREVYWHALAFGFKGQYYFETDDSGELGKLKTLHAQQLAVRPPAFDTVAGDLSTQNDGLHEMPELRSRSRAWWPFGAGLALLAFIAYLLWVLLAGPRESAPTVAQRIEQRLQRYGCADLAASVGREGSVRVTGFVSQPEDVARVQKDVLAMPGAEAAHFDLRVRTWPYCEVVAMLKPYQARNRDKRRGFRVAAISARDGRLREGDPVLIQVANASDDGYLWVDYYTADGAVLHLSPGQARSRTRAGATVELGRDIPSSWLVSPPFGTVLVTALSSPVPVDETIDRPPAELASAYLQWLRELLATSEVNGKLVAEFEFLQTVAR